MDQIYEKLKKLLALAQHGEGGEKMNAQERLESMMRKHGVKLEDFAGESREMEWFTPKRGKLERKLMYQVIANVCGGKISTWKNPTRKGKIGVKVTKAEQVEIELKYAAYVEGLQKEMAITFSAFVHTNRIFRCDQSERDEEPEDVDMEEIKRLAMAMQGMTPVRVNKALPCA